MLELGRHHLREEPSLTGECVERPTLHDAAHLENEDHVRAADGGEAMGDDKGGAPPHQGLQGLLHLSLGGGVQGAGGFVQ